MGHESISSLKGIYEFHVSSFVILSAMGLICNRTHSYDVTDSVRIDYLAAGLAASG